MVDPSGESASGGGPTHGRPGKVGSLSNIHLLSTEVPGECQVAVSDWLLVNGLYKNLCTSIDQHGLDVQVYTGITIQVMSRFVQLEITINIKREGWPVQDRRDTIKIKVNLLCRLPGR